MIEATAGFEGDVGAKLTLERPPKPELGDYSTNAAMLLAPTAGAPPREVAERLRDELDGSLGDERERIEVAGPGFLNVFLSDRWHREATPRCSPPATARAAAAERRRAGPGRVRERQPDRAGDRGERPRRRLRRLAGAAARGGRPRGRARVLRQRRRHPGAAVRRVGRRADAGRRAARGRLRGRVRRRARARSWPRRASTPTTSTRSRVPATEAMRARIEATLERFGVALRHLVVGAPPARDRRGRARARRAARDAAMSTRARARSGCGRPSSATTRTGS